MRKIMVACLFVLCIGWAQAGFAEEISIKAGDTLQSLLEAHKGKKVTVRLSGGEEMTGNVTSVTKELLHLGRLSGKEYFDAVIDVTKITAMIVRTKEQ